LNKAYLHIHHSHLGSSIATMSLKPITLYDHRGPNPFKVKIILEELGIPYVKEDVEEPKGEYFTKINPNGRLPAIKDPNNDDFILWESGAIVEYLVENYDRENKLTLTDAKEKYLLKQFLYLQTSGQGPYYGQAVWFHKYHAEDLPSAKKRYEEQTVRVIGVLDNILKDRQYLVGDKCTYADLSFYAWDVSMLGYFRHILEPYEIEKKYPYFHAWHKRLDERPAVKAATAKRWA